MRRRTIQKIGLPEEKRQRGIHRLRAKELANLAPGWHDDGAGLRFRVRGDSRVWVQRVTINGKRVNRGLGAYPLIDLEAARERSYAMRQAASDGKDLAREKRLKAAKQTTVREAFESYFQTKEQQLSNGKHAAQWTSTMETYVFPSIGKMPVSQVHASDIIKILQPIWVTKAVTASRVLQRLRATFNHAYIQGWRQDDPCRGVDEALGGTGHREVRHHPALPYQDVPTFIQFIRACPSTPITKLAFEWLILTATRSGETREAPWVEIQGDRWVIPKERMKGNAAHVVPLPLRCLQILQEVQDLRGCRICIGDQYAGGTGPREGLIFPGRFAGQTGGSDQPLSEMTFTKVLRDMEMGDRVTAHGFRTSFRTWAAETNQCRREVAEAALAHAIRDKTEAAYHRTSYLEERVGLMARWAAFCAPEAEEAPLGAPP